VIQWFRETKSHLECDDASRSTRAVYAESDRSHESCSNTLEFAALTFFIL
jgi:hypothetical protein